MEKKKRKEVDRYGFTVSEISKLWEHLSSDNDGDLTLRMIIMKTIVRNLDGDIDKLLDVNFDALCNLERGIK